MSQYPPPQPQQQGQWQGQLPPPNTGWQQPSGSQWQQQPQQPYYQPPPPQYQPPPRPPKKKLSRRTWIMIGVGVLVLIIFNAIFNAAKGNDTPTVAATAVPTTIFVNSQATATPIPPTPTPHVVHYPPTTQADLRGLAAQGDASRVHEFHSESVGLTGACPQPKREVTVDPSLTGRQLAEDLLAYFYAQQLDSPCGSIVFAYHSQSEANDLYTAGRINVDVTDASGAINVDPNASNLKYRFALNIGDALTGQEYVVTY